MPAMPQSGYECTDGSYVTSGDCGGIGLTKREYIATQAMQGLVSSDYDDTYSGMAKVSVEMADALLKALETE